MHSNEPNSSRQPASVWAAREAIWRLFEEGQVDANMATAGLLAVDLGTRRRQATQEESQTEDRSHDPEHQGGQP